MKLMLPEEFWGIVKDNRIERCWRVKLWVTVNH